MSLLALWVDIAPLSRLRGAPILWRLALSFERGRDEEMEANLPSHPALTNAARHRNLVRQSSITMTDIVQAKDTTLG
ncbi:uncharacterized protein BDZ99DRAFT_467268 [Mytilinidion resinicola]|uniref:Uncharacterized protein n=1 Tax=Mytilinidion resinicola TaxID=574789 RepID=A0A6A6Y9S7_9PEZI|nr:uncharacterized protein BDZ99DRAFT_467268 [Mytilinidion resinicola]KAF2804577.1 hypothetical protein BDZ99DRAFT_467268 [Mytilinidion resinicola]